MNVQAHHTLAELEQLAKAHRGQCLGTHLQAVLLACQGWTAAAIGEALGFCSKTVVLWISHYNHQGLQGLIQGHSPGRPCGLNPAQLQELQARLDQGATPEDKVSSLRGRDVQRIVQEQFGVRYCRNNIYALLHRLGYSCLMPRPRHEKADPEAQEAFKKRFCRNSSGKFRRPTLLKPSR